ncbi:type IV toxin-antitoxin system AbiEi family antitoxin [Fluviicola taffensis]|uniref:HTH crp-type domain-containing protein n=1 Tax=Fluviicola taffensis (strain DSM 16823 / NCIMB 13979 / RW262) TaxID=755732 RepID=F2IJ63_FLUTR|nr:type IV toxin-antitoxin system AbiEi family antitoxin [Fluviicola taffensis]AEA44933.1 hypothetical protein Fluta_2954 [Fluviicola taffensis DSM 16823]
MYRNNDYIYDAVSKLESLTDFKIEIESKRNDYDAVLTINDHRFKVIAQSNVRNSNKGIVLSRMIDFPINDRKTIIFIADYISKDAAQELRINGINYIDTSGNTNIRNGNLYVFIEGQKATQKEKNNQTRAFQEAGVKLLFFLLSEPRNLQLSYREIAENTKISIGSVSNIMSELEDMHFLLKTKKKRLLKNQNELLERWIVAYNDILKPRIFRKKMRFISKHNFKDASILNMTDPCVWGGEPGASIITNYLRPEKFTLYTNNELADLSRTLEMIPDLEGNVDIYQIFWNQKAKTDITAPPLIIYADLMTSGYERNIETAKMIFENELQHIK